MPKAEIVAECMVTITSKQRMRTKTGSDLVIGVLDANKMMPRERKNQREGGNEIPVCSARGSRGEGPRALALPSNLGSEVGTNHCSAWRLFLRVSDRISRSRLREHTGLMATLVTLMTVCQISFGFV